MSLPFTTLKVFRVTDLFADPIYSVSKLFDGFDIKNFPISCFLEWKIPTDDEINILDSWTQDSYKELRTKLIEEASSAIGDTVMLFVEGTQ